MSVEPPEEAGLAGGEAADEELRLASGVYVGPREGGSNYIPPPPPVPPPPRMKLGHKPDGAEMMARPRMSLEEFAAQSGPLVPPAVRWGLTILGLVIVGELCALVGWIHL